jgi:hypothetical protein
MQQASKLLTYTYSRRLHVTAKGVGALPTHCSIYHDCLMLAMRSQGRHVDKDTFDAQYAQAYANLPPRVVQSLSAHDAPPTPMVTACHKIFMPLDIC